MKNNTYIYNKKGFLIMGKLIDLTGKKFNNLTVIKRTEGKKSWHVFWDCVCGLCGGEKSIQGYALTSGNTKSCGCLLKNNFKNRNGIKLARKEVAKIRNDYERGTYNQRELAVIHKVSQAHISNIINNRYWNEGGTIKPRNRMKNKNTEVMEHKDMGTMGHKTITWAIVDDIRNDFSTEILDIRDLADIYCVPPNEIDDIVNNRSWVR